MNPFLIKSNYTSENLFNEIVKCTEIQVRQIAAGIEWTLGKDPGAVLIGGAAVAHYLKGGRPLTPDMDFMSRDIPRLKSLLEEEGTGFRSLRSGHAHSLGITVKKFNADYIDADEGLVSLNNLVLSTFQLTQFGGFAVKIINPELLAIMKLDLGRGKDIQDGFALLESGALDKTTYMKHLHTLRNDITDYTSLLGYSEMI